MISVSETVVIYTAAEKVDVQSTIDGSSHCKAVTCLEDGIICGKAACWLAQFVDSLAVLDSRQRRRLCLYALPGALVLGARH